MGELDKYASEVRALYKKVWEEDVEKGLWAFMREETRKKRTGEVVD